VDRLTSAISSSLKADTMLGGDMSAADAPAAAGAIPATNSDITLTAPAVGMATLPTFRFELRLVCAIVSPPIKPSRKWAAIGRTRYSLSAPRSSDGLMPTAAFEVLRRSGAARRQGGTVLDPERTIGG
jgi:hypothetical protein